MDLFLTQDNSFPGQPPEFNPSKKGFNVVSRIIQNVNTNVCTRVFTPLVFRVTVTKKIANHLIRKEELSVQVPRGMKEATVGAQQ